ncbi:LPXTG-motif cell wall anchor domain-containing protein [Cellulosimicrobium aquatile]|uniref:LPXTG-motif cell wall anchor domain-containing protein n=1 Tax=Cellulosimicrobium aquatile TaxID=1612203 RepID=A0A1N6SN48_9MICO|nr:LPXTG cell wall anchor domain-containing protein [Cellulosimicrobium aquatile]SIQ42545.1 LPXTG-motif cell wall anchor domain-containing protein [Cellulosimicrobium aquatile]
MYDGGSVAGGAGAGGVLAATGIITGAYWLLALALALVVAGLVVIRFSRRRAVHRTRITSWDELDTAVGVDPEGWR